MSTNLTETTSGNSFVNSEHAEAVAIVDQADFKFWRLQEPFAAELLKEIIFRWRGSSARVWAKPGRWAAYPHRTWRIWMGNISESKLERSLKKLVDAGLIERERHRIAGTPVCAFIRPTELALENIGRKSDFERLKAPLAAHKKPKHDGTLDGIGDGTDDGVGDGTDHTSFPSYSTSPTIPQKTSTCEEGKGKAGDLSSICLGRLRGQHFDGQFPHLTN